MTEDLCTRLFIQQNVHATWTVDHLSTWHSYTDAGWQSSYNSRPLYTVQLCRQNSWGQVLSSPHRRTLSQHSPGLKSTITVDTVLDRKSVSVEIRTGVRNLTQQPLRRLVRWGGNQSLVHRRHPTTQHGDVQLRLNILGLYSIFYSYSIRSE